ncbi:MAG: PHB depolymerase family esterase [Gemmataceae bacterium]
MARWMIFAGLLLACSCNLGKADDGRPGLEKLKGLRDKTGGKLDIEKLREKLKQFKDKKGNAAADAGLKRMTWKVGDVEREALVYLPEKTSQQPPVVFAFHGHFGKMELSARQFAFHQLWPEAVCVYPQGLPTPVPKIDVAGKGAGWQKSIGDQADRDLAFFDAILKSLKTDHQIDDKRVYVAGHSNGGFFSYVLLAARGEQLAAIAPVAGGLNLKDLKLIKPKPVLHVAGEKDFIVPFEMQQKSMEFIRKVNGCDANGKPAGEMCTEYPSKTGTPLVALIHPGSHNVPREAPKRIVEFFKQYKAQ